MAANESRPGAGRPERQPILTPHDREGLSKHTAQREVDWRRDPDEIEYALRAATDKDPRAVGGVATMLQARYPHISSTRARMTAVSKMDDLLGYHNDYTRGKKESGTDLERIDLEGAPQNRDIREANRDIVTRRIHELTTDIYDNLPEDMKIPRPEPELENVKSVVDDDTPAPETFVGPNIKTVIDEDDTAEAHLRRRQRRNRTKYTAIYAISHSQQVHVDSTEIHVHPTTVVPVVHTRTIVDSRPSPVPDGDQYITRSEAKSIANRRALLAFLGASAVAIIADKLLEGHEHGGVTGILTSGDQTATAQAAETFVAGATQTADTAKNKTASALPGTQTGTVGTATPGGLGIGNGTPIGGDGTPRVPGSATPGNNGNETTPGAGIGTSNPTKSAETPTTTVTATRPATVSPTVEPTAAPTPDEIATDLPAWTPDGFPPYTAAKLTQEALAAGFPQWKADIIGELGNELLKVTWDPTHPGQEVSLANQISPEGREYIIKIIDTKDEATAKEIEAQALKYVRPILDSLGKK